MEIKAIPEPLDVFLDKLFTEVENVCSRINVNTNSVYDIKSFCGFVYAQLESLKFAVKFEIEELKIELANSPLNQNQNLEQELKRVSDELTKAKYLIKLQNLTFMIGDHVDEFLSGNRQ